MDIIAVLEKIICFMLVVSCIDLKVANEFVENNYFISLKIDHYS
jgi:hypothetical protein